MADLREHLETLPEAMATDGMKGDLPAVYVFLPGTGATWVLWEYDREADTAFGLCDLGFPEIGYVSVGELVGVASPLGLPVEVDRRVATRFAGYRLAQVDIPDFLQS